MDKFTEIYHDKVLQALDNKDFRDSDWYMENSGLHFFNVMEFVDIIGVKVNGRWKPPKFVRPGGVDPSAAAARKRRANQINNDGRLPLGNRFAYGPQSINNSFCIKFAPTNFEHIYFTREGLCLYETLEYIIY